MISNNSKVKSSCDWPPAAIVVAEEDVFTQNMNLLECMPCRDDILLLLPSYCDVMCANIMPVGFFDEEIVISYRTISFHTICVLLNAID